jgi:hypothetical protein
MWNGIKQCFTCVAMNVDAAVMVRKRQPSAARCQEYHRPAGAGWCARQRAQAGRCWTNLCCSPRQVSLCTICQALASDCAALILALTLVSADDCSQKAQASHQPCMWCFAGTGHRASQACMGCHMPAAAGFRAARACTQIHGHAKWRPVSSKPLKKLQVHTTVQWQAAACPAATST